MSFVRLIVPWLVLVGVLAAQSRDDKKLQELEKKAQEADAKLEGARENLRTAYRRLELGLKAVFDADGVPKLRAELFRVIEPLYRESVTLSEKPTPANRQKLMAAWKSGLAPALQRLEDPLLKEVDAWLQARAQALFLGNSPFEALGKDGDAFVGTWLSPLTEGADPFHERWNAHLASSLPSAAALREASRAAEAAHWDVKVAKDPVLQYQTGAPAGFARVPAGSYVVRTTAGVTTLEGRKKERTINLKETFIGLNEVTQGDYFAWLKGLSPEEREKRVPKTDRGKPLWDNDAETKVPTPKPEDLQLPVIGVSFDSALSYAKAQRARLPTDEEWSAMAGGKEGRMWAWGPAYEKAKANDLQAGSGKLQPVGQLPLGRGPFGHCDVAGNAREWVATYENSKPVDPAKIEDANVFVRGGSFNGGPEDVSNGWLWIKRAYFDQDAETGFRLARDP